jgi:hypothetical protein
VKKGLSTAPAPQRILYFIKNDAVNQLISTLKTLYCP